MAKKKKDSSEPKILDWCQNCKYNEGEEEHFHYMWRCSFLNVCCAFNLGYCKAERLGKGRFKLK